MGDTKAKLLRRGLMIARIFAAALSGIFFAVALSQILFFQNIKISFQTGVDAQQISTMEMKKGTNVDLPTPLKPGSYFMGWSLSPNSAEVLENSTGLMKDTTLYAVWDGAEKYAVLSVNGVTLKEVNIFDTSVEGLTADELNYGKFGNDSWRVLDDYAQDNPNVVLGKGRYGQTVDPYNNFSRFKGWRYLNAYNTYNDLLYEQNESGVAGTWTWVQRDEKSNIISETVITGSNRFYPPNYRTTFTALLDYRWVSVWLYDKGEKYDQYSFQLGEDVTLPVFNNDETAHFSHWEIKADHLKAYINNDEQPALATLVNRVKKRYAAGEKLTIDPLWYYYGNTLMPRGTQDKELVVVLKMNAVYWDDVTVYKYSVQPFTDTDSGSTYKNFSNIGENNLSVENPVAYDEVENCLWLYRDPQIASYEFYDHNGVYHNFSVYDLEQQTNGSIAIGETVTLLGEEIYFNNDWGINVMVNYQSSTKNVTVKFTYGDDLYVLPDYRYISTYTDTLKKRIGSTFEIWTGEKYMKSGYIFTGWRIAGDESERVYYAGEKFTVPNYDTSNESTTIEFVAVWHVQRLLFDFDFKGGSWATEEGPDFTLMKGAYGDRVRVVKEVPVKFGWVFTGWTLEDYTAEEDTNEGDYLQPNDYIVVGTKFQTLYAHWRPMRLSVTYYVRYNAEGDWLQKGRAFVKDFENPDATLKSGGVVELPMVKDSASDYYIFNGWQIGNQVTNASSQQLDTKVLSQLETVVKEDAEGLILHVHIYAAQTKRTLNVNYNFMVGNIDLRENRSTADFVTVLPQGSLFYDYYPFSVARTDGDYTAFDTRGKQFKSWSYSINGSSFIAIDANTRVPSGVSQIMIIGGFTGDKKFEVKYYNNTGELLCQDTNDRNYYNYDSSNFQLKNYNDVQITQAILDWGTFVGWSVEPDFKSGNPEVIYDVHYYVLEHKTSSNPNPHPLLHLTNQMDTICSPYKIDIDRYAIQEDGLIYTLHLYAVYANDSVNINYANKSSNGNLKIPLYSSNDYTHATIGGCTVGYNSNDFIVQGVTVLDDYSVGLVDSWNFVGWKIGQLENVSQKIQEQFADRIWFSGDYLPSIDFSFNFSLQYVEKDNLIHQVTVGTKTYQILSLSNGTDKVVVDCSSGIVKIGSTTIPCPDGVDIVVLPRGDYTVGQGNIVINSTREVHVVVPSVGNIVLEPRAIQCNTIKEFYVPENVTVTGSPVVGDNFQAYHVQKGYRVLNDDGSISGVLNASTKYNFAASLKGLLVSLDGTTLYGVPSHTSLTTEELLAFINESITKIVPYALSDINSLRTLSLAKNSNLQIDELAIFNGTMRNIILPAGNALSGLEINSQALAGALTDLISVTFGDANTTATWYAFVDGDFVYYLDNLAVTDAKTHVMYALRSVKLNNLTYHNLDTVTNNLTIADTVTKIEPYALAGLNWTQIHSVTANNVNVDLRFLKGIATDIPLFTDKDNPHQGPMIQPYLKTFRFVYKEGLEEASVYTVEFAYGQTFRVFNAQSNNYGFKFNRAWSQFQGWKIGNNNQRIDVGRIFKVGMDELVLGDKYTVQFNASSDDCWKQYLIQFQTFNDEFSANDFKFEDFDGKKYAISDLKDNNLGNIYLPAVDQNITIGGVVYQFIGWSTTKRGASGATPNLWNNVDQKLRVLPNRTTSAVLNKGTRVGGVYVYYALYEPVTPNLHYDPLDANGSDLEDTDTNVSTYAVSAPIQFNATSINIPFAHFNAGYMVPISTVRNFNISTNTALTEIVIGAAVSKINAAAFQNVQAMQIKFNHKGRKIYYNNSSNTNWLELTISANAFANNAALENVVLPAAVVTLGDSAFRACNNLYSVTFEAADSLAICNLGDFVFRDDTNLTNNALVGLLAADSNKERFGAVGNGIFMHTKVDSVDNSHKIVWGDTLLHVHYDNGSTEYTFNEKIIAGYAFADLGSSTASNIVIKFTNPGVRIKAKAFSFLHNSVSTIRLNTATAGVIQPSNVDAHAFDDLTDHNVAVYTPDKSAWDKDFNLTKGTISNNIIIHGPN